MKKCKIIHIIDGKPSVLMNENFRYVEEYTSAEELINAYLAEGYEVKHMIPEISPAQQKEGEFTFYKNGFTVYLEKEE